MGKFNCIHIMTVEELYPTEEGKLLSKGGKNIANKVCCRLSGNGTVDFKELANKKYKALKGRYQEVANEDGELLGNADIFTPLNIVVNFEMLSTFDKIHISPKALFEIKKAVNKAVEKLGGDSVLLLYLTEWNDTNDLTIKSQCYEISQLLGKKKKKRKKRVAF